MASINKVIIMGNLTADPELKTTSNGTSVTSFTVAVQRRYARETDEVKADFINVVAWRQTAEFITKYFTKGRNIFVEGSIQTRNYTASDGSKRYITEVVADNVQFGSSQGQGGARSNDATYYGAEPAAQPKVSEANFEEVPAEDDLPF